MLAKSQGRVMGGKGGTKAGGVRTCTGAHSCITSVTGPYAYRAALRGAARTLGCRRGDLSAKSCASSSDLMMRSIFRCTDVEHWYCDAARHWDCRNSPARRPCGSRHYTWQSHKTVFFDPNVTFNFDEQHAARGIA